MKSYLLVLSMAGLLSLSCTQEEKKSLDLEVGGTSPTAPESPAAPACLTTSKILSQEITNGGTGFNGGSDYSNHVQELTFLTAVKIKSIEMRLRSDKGTESITLDLRSHNINQSPDISEASLGTATVGNIPSSSSWVKFEFANPIDLSAGSYIIDLTTDSIEANGEDVVVWGNGLINTDSYPGHQKYRRSVFGFWHGYDTDLAFRINACL
ncbi:MAG: hypothetical protein CME70_05255 [Halobacteriovorax sp.]|nr:hypothetical protein [Halobacteriovorax sp.]|tara:strand:+ start:84169 stop:84798 length:630 start_codon:yes stop_codon:yes gene_type:complete